MNKILPPTLYFLVGMLSLVMAFKSFFSDGYLSFHEKAADIPWNKIERPLQLVILSLLRLGGLGFLVVSILLMVFPVVDFFHPYDFYKYSIPAVAFVFCSGLFANNYWLYKKTKAATPWKGSLYAMLIILAGMIVSAF